MSKKHKYKQKHQQRIQYIYLTMNVFEFEEVHCMSVDTCNFDVYVDVPYWTITYSNPIYNINAKEAEITEMITVEDSHCYFHFHQIYLHLKKYLWSFKQYTVVMYLLLPLLWKFISQYLVSNIYFKITNMVTTIALK